MWGCAVYFEGGILQERRERRVYDLYEADLNANATTDLDVGEEMLAVLWDMNSISCFHVSEIWVGRAKCQLGTSLIVIPIAKSLCVRL
jgi:hypothetical protein